MKKSDNYQKKLHDLKRERYTWGDIVEIHEIGNYIIVEYKAIKFDGCSPVEPRSYEEKSTFHPYIDGDDQNESYDSLDHALAACICVNNGTNTRASMYFMKMVKND
jgi:hypothetical protein